MLAFLAAFDVGDRVALARPGYPAYKNILSALGCEVVELDCGPETRYQPTVSQLTRRTTAAGSTGHGRAPANPTGTMITPAELAAIAEWCADHDVRLISDEIYHGIAYSDEVAQATAATYLGQGAVVVNSFSKYWAMTGWRLGWLRAARRPGRAGRRPRGQRGALPPALAQHAGIAAFTPEGYAAAAENVGAVRGVARPCSLERLGELGWRPVAPADGAFYLYGDIAVVRAGLRHLVRPAPRRGRRRHHTWDRLRRGAGARLGAAVVRVVAGHGVARGGPDRGLAQDALIGVRLSRGGAAPRGAPPTRSPAPRARRRRRRSPRSDRPRRRTRAGWRPSSPGPAHRARCG